MNLFSNDLLSPSLTAAVGGGAVGLSVMHLNGCACSNCCSVTADFSSDGSVAEEDFTLQSENFRWKQPGGKGSPVTLEYSFTNLFNGGIKGSINKAQMKAAIEESFELWSKYAPVPG